MDTSKVFEYLLEYKGAHDGNSPTVREIMRGCGMKSESTTWRYLRELEAQGRIRVDGGARGIRVMGGEWIAPRG